MSRIKLDIEQMLSIATRYEEQSNNIGELIAKLDQMLIELQTYWEGSSATKFEENYLTLKPSIIQLQEVILTTSMSIKHTASSMSEVDNIILG